MSSINSTPKSLSHHEPPRHNELLGRKASCKLKMLTSPNQLFPYPWEQDWAWAHFLVTESGFLPHTGAGPLSGAPTLKYLLVFLIKTLNPSNVPDLSYLVLEKRKLLNWFTLRCEWPKTPLAISEDVLPRLSRDILILKVSCLAPRNCRTF